MAALLPRSRVLLGTLCWTAVTSIAGCSERHTVATTTTAVTPQHEPVQETADSSGDILKASLNSGNVTATYRAAFEAGQLKRISEERSADGSAARHADYVFQGARLIEYTGAALQSGATVELRLDLQGGLLAANGSAGKPDQSEINAIVNRAQLLRSHALARQASRSHGM